MRKDVIFDCDPGHDDAMALLWALSSSQLNIRLITTCAGNQTQDKTLLNTLKLLSFIDVTDIEVARGKDKPLKRELIIADNIHGESGLDGADLGQPVFRESKRSALEAAREVLEHATEPVTIVATGPLTNIAVLLLAYPHLACKVECISIMGGACFGGNWTPAAEFNIYVDPEAADIVFRSGVPIVMSGLDVTHKAVLYRSDIERMRNLGNKTGAVMAELMDFFASRTMRDALSDPSVEVGVRMHDACAVGYLIDPGMFHGISCNVEVETSSPLTLGSTVVDYNRRTGKPHNATVLFGVDRERFADSLIAAVGTFR